MVGSFTVFEAKGGCNSGFLSLTMSTGQGASWDIPSFLELVHAYRTECFAGEANQDEP